ncbi:MAG: HAD-IA family hydrolase [Parcubacteria group bacterium]|nr:HAD-IA family hydrolase [Parcubacteria group bacterium]
MKPVDKKTTTTNGIAGFVIGVLDVFETIFWGPVTERCFGKYWPLFIRKTLFDIHPIKDLKALGVRAVILTGMPLNGTAAPEERNQVCDWIKAAKEVNCELALVTHIDNQRAITWARKEHIPCFEYASPKPSPRMFRLVLSRMQRSWWQGLVIGDSLPAIANGKRAGIPTVLTDPIPNHGGVRRPRRLWEKLALMVGGYNGQRNRG